MKHQHVHFFILAAVCAFFAGPVSVSADQAPAALRAADKMATTAAVLNAPSVPTAAERAELIKSGATDGATDWSVYIVRLDDAPVARYRGGIGNFAPTSPRATGAAKLDVKTPESQAYAAYLGNKHVDFMNLANTALARNIDVVSSYRYAFNGVAVWVRNDEVATIAALDGVHSVDKEKLRKLNTDAGPEWIGAPAVWGGAGTVDNIGTEGEGIVIGVIDSGVNSDHPSYADIGPVDGYDHVNPFTEYKGLCEPLTGLPYCNDKLVGVYDCNGGSTAVGGGGGGGGGAGPDPRPLAGTVGTFSCSVLDGPHDFLTPGGTSIEFTVVTANDITMNLYYSTDINDPDPTQVVAYDFLLGVETLTYQPFGGVAPGYYWAEVCPFDPLEPDVPTPYTGSLIWSDSAGFGDACFGGQPEDDNDHGSHTSSTAAGNRVNADIIAPTITIERQLKGVAPHANLIVYAGCTPAGNCLGASLENAIEQIVIDGVDVVNFSIGGGPGNPWGDADSQGFLSAREAGIWVATSASNDGPGAGSIGSPADSPWITTVGASTHNRILANRLEALAGGNSSPPGASVLGKGLTSGYPAGTATAPIIYAGDTPANADLSADPALCSGGDIQASTNPWLPLTFSGEIVVCDRGTFARTDKCKNACEAGAGGCILANDAASGDSLVADGHACPAVHISYNDGVALKAWLADGAAAGSHVGRITGTFADLSPSNGDVQAGFSSRGPNSAAPNSLKPDVTNPGVDILAAYSTLRSTTVGDEYGTLSGTSMSSPHTAGSLALLRAKRPELTPAEAQSALMMTSTRDFTRDSNNSIDPSDPFDRGAGRVDMTAATRAGLVMDVESYGTSAADAKGLNIPSFSDVDCQSSCSWTREVKSVAPGPVTWTAGFNSDDGVNVTVVPSQFTLNPGAIQLITVTANIASADHATPQGDAAGALIENETQDTDEPLIPDDLLEPVEIVYHACDGPKSNGNDNDSPAPAGRAFDCWVFADISLASSDPDVPDVSMPLAARSTGDFDNDGFSDLVDTCPTLANPGQETADADLDGVPDVCDNCLLETNADQCDTNGDGYGNVCDADLDNNNITNSFDLSIMRTNFGQVGDNDSDLDCNGVVNSFDLTLMRQNFGQAPGPSGLVP